MSYNLDMNLANTLFSIFRSNKGIKIQMSTDVYNLSGSHRRLGDQKGEGNRKKTGGKETTWNAS